MKFKFRYTSPTGEQRFQEATLRDVSYKLRDETDAITQKFAVELDAMHEDAVAADASGSQVAVLKSSAKSRAVMRRLNCEIIKVAYDPSGFSEPLQEAWRGEVDSEAWMSQLPADVEAAVEEFRKLARV
jgi:hypothetical protein